MIAKLDPMLLEKKQTRRLELEKFKKKRMNTVFNHFYYVLSIARLRIKNC